MTSRSYFGKMNLTLGSVVPLAMFTFYILQLFLFSSQPRVVDTAGPPSPQNGLAGKTEVKKTSNSKDIKNDYRPSHRGKVCIPSTNCFHTVNHS